MTAAALAVVLASTLIGHSASQGKSAFRMDDDGTVRVEIQLGALDLPELCNVDFSLSDPEKRAQQVERFETCVSGGIRHWIRVRADDVACPLEYQAWRTLEPPTTPPVLAINAIATCGKPASQMKRFGIDWGLFGASPLDHTSVAKIELAGVEPAVFAFSKRARKYDVELPARWMPFIAGVASCIVVVGAVVAAAFAMRRRRSLTPDGSR